MITYPNQKIIKIHSEKHDSANKENPYGCISRIAEQTATKKLNDGTASYMLYIHLALCQNNYKFALSPKAIYESIGLTEKQYRKAIKRLVDTGYLVKSSTVKNEYDFYELPRENTPPTENMPPQVENTPPTGIDTMSPQREIMYPHRDREIIHNNIINNTVNIDYANKCFGIFDDDDCDADIDVIFPEDNQKEKSIDINHEYEKQLYNAQWKDSITGLKIQLIMDKYLSTHKESETMQWIGNKYGRIIKGWDEAKQEPIVNYSIYPRKLKDMEHNISDIPREYYKKNNVDE